MPIYSKKIRALVDAGKFDQARALLAPAKEPMRPRTEISRRGIKPRPKVWKQRNPIARSSKPKARNAKRHKKNWLRAHGSLSPVAWVKAQPSVASGKGPCVNAHVGKKGAGTQRKADADQIVPLTDHEHRHELHSMGRESFEQHYNISLEGEAYWIEAGWQAHCAAMEDIT